MRGCTKVSKMTFAPSSPSAANSAREILNMHGRGNDGARNAQTLCDMPLHLAAEHELGLEVRDLGFDFEIIVGDQRLDTVELGGFANLPCELARIGAESDHLKPSSAWAIRAAAIAWVASPKTNTRLPVRYVESTDREYQGRRDVSVSRTEDGSTPAIVPLPQ